MKSAEIRIDSTPLIDYYFNMKFYIQDNETNLELRVKTSDSLDQHVAFLDGVIVIKDAKLLARKLNETRNFEKFSFQ